MDFRIKMQDFLCLFQLINRKRKWEFMEQNTSQRLELTWDHLAWQKGYLLRCTITHEGKYKKNAKVATAYLPVELSRFSADFCSFLSQLIENCAAIS